jgi:EAL domain-containing protein (putative c-di-GMP-specific phosphodiesterase class I)
MLSDADLALQSAKRAGGGRTVRFDANLAALEGRRIALDRDLRSAIERDELFLAYQPIVDAGESIVAVEALLRWVHPIHGRIPPDEFIPLAEANGTIVPIGRWVMQRACAETATLRNVCGRPLRVAVNVSAKQFSDADLQAVIHQALALCDLEPSALEIEVTESTIARHPAHASRVLRDLRAAGVTVAIDDFGTGQSSLASLRRHPVDNLKIDRSFVATTPDDAEACAIVEVILALAKQLSLGVVAEGVETAEQAHYLRSRGVTRLQGYHYSRPISARSLAELLATSSKSRFRARPFPAPARVRG